MATALDPFSQFTLTTGPAFMSDSRSILNATLRHYYLLARFMSGKPMEQILQGGSEIKDIIYLEQDSNAEFYRADAQQFSYRNQQVGTSYKLDWRMLANNTSWTDHEIGLNETGGMSQGPGTFHRFKYYRDLKMMNLWTTTIEKMEAQLFAPAYTGDMEASTGSQPYSLGASIVDNADGHAPSWSTVQSIDPDDYANWDNQRGTYTAADLSAAGGAAKLWAGMRTVYTKCKFTNLPRFGAYGKASTSPAFIAASLWGIVAAEMALQSKQDLLMGGPGKDPAFNGPTFSGTPIVYVDSLDSAALFTDGVAGSTERKDEAGTGTGSGSGTFYNGPRFWFINGRCVNVIWHKNRMFHKVPPFHPDEEPFKKVLVTDNWYNVVNQNRRESGMLSPAATVTAPAQP